MFMKWWWWLSPSFVIVRVNRVKDILEFQKMGKKSKKDRDPAAPKPPLNPYLEFSQEERKKILLEAGTRTTTEIAKEIGSRWRALPKEEKEVFEKRFRDNKEKFMNLKMAYEENTDKPENEVLAVVKPKKKRDPLAPKQPLSSFMEFGKEERKKIFSELGSLSLADVGRELGRRWRDISKEEKLRFDLKSRENRETFEREKNSSKQNDPDLATTDVDAFPQDEDLPGASSPSDSPSSILLSDLGFAQQKKYPFHPALKTGTIANGTRVRVTFFGTGQSVTVDKSKWVVFSKQSEDRIKTPSQMKSLAFKNGLEQMRSLCEKLQSDEGTAITSPGIEFTPQIGGRIFKTLNKDHLQQEEEENMVQMGKKMRKDEGGLLWVCRDCGWRGRYCHRAKAHARSCGQRKKVSTKKSKEKKFQCSNGACGLSFGLRSHLVRHYR